MLTAQEISIKRFLIDGTRTGICMAEGDYCPSQAFKIPRAELKLCEKEKFLSDSLHSPGIYFMFGQDDRSEINDKASRDFVYIGKGSDVLERVRKPHEFEKNGEYYWQNVVVLVASSSHFNDTKIKYLEKMFIKIADEAGQHNIINTNKMLNRKDSNERNLNADTLEKIVEDAKLYMLHLGYRVFEPQPSPANTAKEDYLYFSRKVGGKYKIEATGVRKEDSFWVLKGSVVCREEDIADYLPTGYKDLRAQYRKFIEDQKLTQNIKFNSPSAASSFVCGRNSNGLTDWKNKDGVSLKELDADNSSSEPTGLPAPANRNRQTRQRKKETTLPADIEVLSFASKKYSARGYYLADSSEFVVLKRSKMNPEQRKACVAGIAKTRNELVKSGKVKDFVFLENVPLGKPSKAASVIAGGNSNGWDLWKDSNGRKLKDIIKR